VTPAGWTAVYGADGVRPTGRTDSAANVFWRAWQAGDPATQAFTASAAGYIIAVPLLVRGAEPAAPVESSAWASIGASPAGTLQPAPSLQPVRARMLVTCHSTRSGGAATKVWTTPAGMTELADYAPNNTSGSNSVAVHRKTLADSSATGPQSASVNVTCYPVGFSLLLKEPMSGSVTKGKGGVPVALRYKGQPV
jgi:hypothetical protein